MEKSTLITGATGFLGREIVRRLTEQGQRVVALVRDRDKAVERLPADVLLIERLSDLEQIPDRLVNLAGEPIARRWTHRAVVDIESSRIDLTTRLLAQFERLGGAPGVVLSGSAIGWYGYNPADRVDERAGVGNGYAASLCDRWEAAAKPFRDRFGSRLVLLRTGLVLGAGGGILKQLLPLYRLGLGGPVGSGGQWMPWIHQYDYTSIVCRIIEDETFSGPANLVAPEPVEQREFAAVLASLLRRPHVVPTPAFTLRFLYGRMADELLLGGAHIASRRLPELDYEFRFPALEPALRDVLDT